MVSYQNHRAYVLHAAWIVPLMPRCYTGGRIRRESHEAIIWSFSLYHYGMPSHLKAVLDRTIPLVQIRMKEVNGSVQHEALVDFAKKRILVICGAGFPDWDGNFDGLRAQCRNSFGDPTMVCVPETPLMNVSAAREVAEAKLAAFRRAGEEYARSGKLTEATIAELEQPMIPREEYLRQHNQAAGI